MENKSHALMAGLFTAALLAAAVLAAVWLNRDRTERLPYLVATRLALTGLNPQATVRYRGIKVGKVDGIEFDPKTPGQVLVLLAVDPDTPITKSTFATLGYQGVTGLAYVELDDDGKQPQLLPTTRANPARLELRPSLIEQVASRGKVILAHTEEITQRLNTLLLPANQDTAMHAVDQIGKAATAFEALPRQLAPTIDKLPAIADQAQSALASVSALSDDARKLAKSLNRATDMAQAPGGTLARLTETVEKTGATLDGVVREIGQETLPRVAATADEVRTTLKKANRAVDNLNEQPQSLLLGGAKPPPGPGEAGFSAPDK